MNEPMNDSAPEAASLTENEPPVSSSGLRESLMQESDIQIQSMPDRYGRAYPQQNNQSQQTCQPTQSCQPCREKSPYKGTDVAYQAALPYPLAKPQCKHPQYAAAMLDNLAGQFSEMTAISFYFYSSLISSEYKEIAETFHHINMVEMHHLEIFGELAKQLGENPRLWSRRGRGGRYQYWSPAFFKYPFFPLPAPSCDSPCEPQSNQAMKQLLMLAIDSEKEAIRKYMQQTTWIQDINVCDNLRRIAADEELHLEILTRLYHKL